MLTRQALAVTTAVGRALRVPIDPRRLAAARRRRAPTAATPTALADHIIEVGREQQLTYLRRRSAWAAVQTMLADRTVPLVLVLGGPPAHDVLVIEGVEGETVRAVSVGPDAAERYDDALSLSALQGRIGDLVVEILIPMSVPGSISGARTGPSDGDRQAPSPVARLFRLLGHERRLISYVYLYAGLAGLFGLALPLGVQAIIGLVSGGMIFQPVVLLIAFVIIGILANGGLQIMQLSVVETVQQRVFTRYAFEIGALLPRVRLDRVNEVDLPELMNRFFEIKMIQKTLSKILTDWVAAVLQVVFGIILLTFYHPYFSLLGLVLVATLVGIFWWLGSRGLQTSLHESRYKYRVAHWLQQLSRNLPAFKFAGRGDLPVERLDEEVTGYLAYRQEHFRVLVKQSWAFVAFKTVISGAVLILGALLVVNRSITLGQFVASELVIVAVLLAVEKAMLGLGDVYDLLTAVEKAGHITDLAAEPSSGLVPPPGGDPRGIALGVRDLSFTYPDGKRPVLDGISLTILPGERVAITGAEGAGESTLLAVVGGLFENYVGAITHDNVSLRELDRMRAREQVAHSGSTIALFEGSVEENIAMGRSWVRTEDVLEAVATVGMLDWVHEQPQGLQSRVASDGRGIPSQVARKMELARCLAGRPRMLLLDDVFDVLDPPSKRRLMSNLLSPDAPWTVLAVSHDPQVLAACDRILVLRDGAVASSGTYEELRRSDPYFRELAPT
ncbi:MAG: ABC transporter ATP-binding protein [Gemmatimonadaceae bacterium]|nr:ABC transporter ATP-binding protein [Gemmatimonadaceae bacterium]